MDLFIKTRNEICKVNSNIMVTRDSNFYIVPDQGHYVLLIDNNYYKSETDALTVLKKIYSVLDRAQYAVTNIIVYNIVGDDIDGLD